MQIQLGDQQVFAFSVPPGDIAKVTVDRGSVTHVVSPPSDFARRATGQMATGQSQRFTHGATLRGEGLTELTIEWELHEVQLPEPPRLPDAEPEPEPEPEG